MPPLLCPECGAPNSELNIECVACGSLLPEPADETLDMGENFQGPPRNGGGNRKAPPAEGDQGEREDSDDEELRPGQQISHFRILGRLGRGGMGEVYRALDLSLERVVALKFLHERRRPDLARLKREAKTAASLDHPNIGTIYDFREWKGRHFIVMALYEGETLAERLARQPGRRLPAPETAALINQLACGLQAAHAAGLVHRDVKPDNVMILPDGRVKLIDFGLARRLEWPRLTAHGNVVGTLDYMAPEQLDPEKVAEPMADLWALGVVLYVMLAGRHPFGGEGLGKAKAILNEKHFPLREACPEVPAALERIVEGCLVKEPEKRWPSAGKLLAEIERSGLLGSGPRPRPPAWQLWMLGAAAAILLVAIVVILYLLLRKPAPPVYVVVLKPVVTGALQPDDRARVAANMQGSLSRAVAELDGLAALDNDQVNKLTGDPKSIAFAMGAGEVITSRADCAGDLCKVSLKRLSGKDERVLWEEALPQQLPLSKPRLFAEAVATSLRKGYGNHKRRARQLEHETREEDYSTYLELRLRADVPGALPKVLEDLGALRRRAPDFLEVYSFEANVARRLYESSGDESYMKRGIEVAQEARKRAPTDPRPLASLFYIYLKAKNYLEAEKVLEHLEDLDPAGSLFKRGLLIESQGRPEEGLALMAEATRRQPSWPALLMLANHEYSQGHLDEAQKHYGELLRRVPDKIDGSRGLALIALQRDPRRSIPLLQKIAAKAPDADSFINLGIGLLLERRYAEAEESFRRARKLQPDSPSILLNIADCLTLRDHFEDARPLYLDVVAKAGRATTPDDWAILSVRAQALAHLGDSAHAVEAIQQALRIAPRNPHLACAAAVVYTLAGDQDSAIEHARLAAPGALENPFLDPLRQNPTFQQLLKGAGDPAGL
jgi:serine/threonine-protein kinase